MVNLSLKNPYFIGVLVVIIGIMGTIAYSRLPKDLLPRFRIPAVQVLTLYPGMPTEVVEKDITSRIERWTGQSIGIDKQESRSMLGVSIVRNYFRSDVDMNSALSQVTSLAMSDLYYLPPGTIPPMVMPFDPTATVPLALLTVSSDSLNEKELYEEAQLTGLRVTWEVRGAIEEYRRTMQLANLARKRRDTGDRTLVLAHNRYASKGGILSEWDLAYRAWLQSELDYWDVDAEQKNAIIGLYHVAGALPRALQP